MGSWVVPFYTDRMPECNTDGIDFTGHDRRKVIADFNGGRLTSDAGILLLREVDKQLGFVDSINAFLPDPRDPRFIEETGEKQRLFSETKYATEAWDHERRVVMKAERLLAGPNTRFIGTNLKGRPQALYDKQIT